MNLHTFLGLCITALAMAGCAAPPPGATQAMQEGLVAVQSRNLDGLYVRPDANLPGYRRVMIDPVRVDVRTQMHAYNRIQSPAVYPEDVARFAEETPARRSSTSRRATQSAELCSDASYTVASHER